MDPMLSDRVLALPESVRATLATAEGPGWYVSRRDGELTMHDNAPYAHPKAMGQRGAGFTDAWWPADYPAAIAAVKGWDLSTTYEALEVHARCCPEKTGAELAIDIIAHTDEAEDAAVAIIEARAARSDAPRQTVTTLGKVGEVVNLQGPVTLSIGADGVKVVR